MILLSVTGCGKLKESLPDKGETEEAVNMETEESDLIPDTVANLTEKIEEETAAAVTDTSLEEAEIFPEAEESGEKVTAMEATTYEVTNANVRNGSLLTDENPSELNAKSDGKSADSINVSMENSSSAETSVVEETSTPVAYSPESVVSLATARIKAGGKLLLSEEMDRMLAEGSISKEDYDVYYPYDGTGYYSVFVETDLNEASTTSGRLLGSEDGIAQYIADMLLLETVPSVEIEYAGVYTSNTGGTFYEFRCHR